MHPLERLRYVARAEGAEPALVAREAASALAEVAVEDPAGLVPACRRLIERHLTAGPVWWLCAQVLGGPDALEATLRAGPALDADATDRVLARHLPDDTSALIIGWPDVVAGALRRRGDLEVLIVEGGGEGRALARRLTESGNDVSVIPDTGVGAAAAVAGLVLLEARAAGPGGLLAAPGSAAAAAMAARRGTPVWAVVPTGTLLPGRLWDALVTRLDADGREPWDREVELVTVDLLTAVIGPEGLDGVAEGLARATCPEAPELLRAAAA